MGYIKQGKFIAYFIRMDDEFEKDFHRLLSIGRRTKSKWIKKKLAKRADVLVSVRPE